MGEKKRKEAPTSTEVSTKKAKKAAGSALKANILATDNAALQVASNAATKNKSKQNVDVDASATTAPVDPSPAEADLKPEKKKKTAKKALAALSTTLDVSAATIVAETNSRPDKNKKSKKTKDQTMNGELSTADGINGVIERAGSVSIGAPPSSMLAEAQRTQDDEIEEKFGPAKSDQIEGDEDLGGALLAGFDSDTPDHAEDRGLDKNDLGGIPNYKKTSKQLRKVKENGVTGKSGAIYVGRIPHGFYEKEMREYFSQFGDITRLRLSRSRRTGASKHFAFIEFASEEVAKIAADTMDNYLMFGHILKCKYAPHESLHPEVWKGANKKYRKIPHGKIDNAKLEAPKTTEQWRKKNEKEERKRARKAKELKEKMDYDAPDVKLTDPEKALAFKSEEHKKSGLEDGVLSLGQAEQTDDTTKTLQVSNETLGTNGGSVKNVNGEVAATRSNGKVVHNSTNAAKKAVNRDGKGKYVPPLKQKQVAQAKNARADPVAHKHKKEKKLSDRKQKRVEKKERRLETMREKFGSKNVKGGENYKSSKRKENRAEARANPG